MGVMDFIEDAGAAVGIGKSSKEKAAAAAREKAVAARAAAEKKAVAEKRAAAAAAKKRALAASKVKAAKAKEAAARAKEAQMEAAKAKKLTSYISGLGLKARGLEIGFDNGVASVKGIAANAATKEKIVLALGNVEGVRRVRDTMKVAPQRKTPPAKTVAARRAAAKRRSQAARAQTMHTVKSGDTLSKISKKYLGDAGRYMEIFNANKPMLTNPDLINVGQVLRIPRK